MRRLLVLLLAASALGCPQTTPTTPPPRPPTPPVTTPPPVAQVPDPALEVASQSFHSCARRKSGEVSCWGKNTYGQLGDGKREDASGPVKVPLVGAVQLAPVATWCVGATTRTGSSAVAAVGARDR
jgi:alpha-tubulin suppressor-like RCC1 family protein